jgi:hypothetical protein
MAKPQYYTPEDEITFNIIDENTVEQLQREGDINLPRRRIDVPKDERWNTKLMSSRLLEGILGGYSVPTIANSINQVINSNVASATRNARTMVTGAENVGRYNSYQNLADQGVIQKKIWMATADDRTRDSHFDLDGQERDIDKVFSNGLMYPGDPKGDPSEVWNCRCTMRDKIVGFRRADGSISEVEATRSETIHEQQIRQERERRQEKPGKPEEIIARYKTLDYGEIQDQLLNMNSPVAGEFYSILGKHATGSYASAWQSYIDGTASPELTKALDDFLSSINNPNINVIPKVVEPPKPVLERIECEMVKNTMDVDDYTRFMDLVNDADNSELYRRYADEIDDITRTKTGGAFAPSSNSIEYSYSDQKGRYSTLSHEYNHFFDQEVGRDHTDIHFSEINLINDRCRMGSSSRLVVKEWASASDEFLSALRSDMDALNLRGLDDVFKELHRTSPSWYNASHGIQDMLDGFFGTQARYGGWGHGNRYYDRGFTRDIKPYGHAADLKAIYKELGINISNQTQAAQRFRQYEAASEAWANIGAAVTCGGEELDAIKKYAPNALKAYLEIVGGLI